MARKDETPDGDRNKRQGEAAETRDPTKKARDEERERLQREVAWPFGERKTPEPPR